MAVPRGPYRKGPVDHVAEALMHLEQAEAALGRVDDAKVNAKARAGIAKAVRGVTSAQRGIADSIEALLGGRLRVQQTVEPTVEPRPRRSART